MYWNWNCEDTRTDFLSCVSNNYSINESWIFLKKEWTHFPYLFYFPSTFSDIVVLEIWLILVDPECENAKEDLKAGEIQIKR